MKTTYAAGGRFETDGWQRRRQPRPGRRKSQTKTVDVGVEIAGGRTYDTAESDPVRYASERADHAVSRSRRHSRFASGFVSVKAAALLSTPLWALAMLTISAAPATAACVWTTTTDTINGQIRVQQVYHCGGDAVGGRFDTDGPAPPRNSQVDSVCVRNAIDIGSTRSDFCDIPAEAVAAVAAVQLTPDMVAAAFARIPLPASQLAIQPANGRTLVNFDTNFYTDSSAFTRTVTLLGRQVTLDITPTTWTWTFGDGTTTSTSTPGAPYPALDITHAYQRKGRVDPSVATTYTATYRVGGGPSRPVPGAVTIPGPAVALDVRTAPPRLVGSH